MRSVFTIKTILIGWIALLHIMCTGASSPKAGWIKPDNLTDTITGDTSLHKLQQAVDAAYPTVALYSVKIHHKTRLAQRIDSLQAAIHSLDAIIDSAGGAELLKVVCPAGAKAVATEGAKAYRALRKQISLYETRQQLLQREAILLQDSVARMERELLAAQPAMEALLNRVHQLLQPIGGAVTLRFNQVPYRLFFVSAAHKVVVHARKEGGYTFGAYKNQLKKGKRDTVLMMTNGGMFKADYQPQGLLVSDGNVLAPLDSNHAPQAGNFYLYPNGVFYIDSGKYRVAETQAYLKRYAPKNRQPGYATQSGPMLVSNGSIHHQFNWGSANLNIRSGVGIQQNGRAVFALSEAPVNFYDFSVVFLYLLNCNDALYLDGAISRMYFGNDRLLPDGTFGPMVAVMKNK